MRVLSRAAVVFASVAALCAAIASDTSRTSAAAPSGVRAYAPPPVFRRAAPMHGFAAAKRTLNTAAVSGCRAQTNADGEFVLRLEYADGLIYNPVTEKDDRVHLRTYNGCITAPTIDAKQGETLRILVDNALPRNAPTCDKMDPRIGCWNTTNLHTHGLHVSPSGHADNVMITVEPGVKRPTVIPITADHPAGTFWYHPHAHGSTSIQTTSGMEGVLIIRGNRKYSGPGKEADIDTILHDRDASGKPVPFRERVMLMQQISYACFTDTTYSTIITTDGKPGSPWACPGDRGTRGVVENFQKQLFDKSAWQKSGRFTTIDGAVQPTLTAEAGRIERWRLVHGGVSDTIQMKIVKAIGSSTTAETLSHEHGTPAQQLADVNDKCGSEVVPQYEIALDGLTRRRIQEIAVKPGLSQSNVLQSGYRSDVLVVFPSVGTYCVIDENQPAVADISTGRSGVPRTRRLLAIVEVPTGSSVTPSLDYIGKQLAAANADLPAGVRTSLEKGDISPWTPFPHDLASSTPDAPCPDPSVPVQDGPLKCVLFAGGETPADNTINDRTYDHTIRFRGTVGTTDKWVVTGGPHIYHIHVNPFQIADIRIGKVSIYNPDGSCKDKAGPTKVDPQYCGQRGVFRDTLMINPRYTAVLLSKYEEFDGHFVIHCHILDHEDAGMMAEVELVKPGMRAHAAAGSATGHMGRMR